MAPAGVEEDSSAVWTDRVKPMLSLGFYVIAAGVVLAPFLLLPVLADLLGPSPMQWVGDPVPAVVFAVALFATLALQLRVYRAVAGPETTETLSVRRLAPDTVRVGAVTTACFGPPVGLLLVASHLQTAGAAVAWFVLFVGTVVAGAYVYPAALSVLATGRSVPAAMAGPHLRQVLRSPMYCRYWGYATSLEAGGLLAFTVAMLVLYVLGAVLLSYLVVLVMPLLAIPFFLTAPLIGAWVSTVAATGVSEAMTVRPQP